MKRKLKVVLDTNVLLVSISSKSKYHWLFQSIIEEQIEVFITNEILLEYEGILNSKWNESVGKAVVRTLIELDNVHLTTPYFKLNIIDNDKDDNKFVDCAFANNVHYLVTNDADFNVLRITDFPKINVITIAQLKEQIVNSQ